MKRSTPNYMVYGETGVTPISIDIEEKKGNFWTRISSNNNNNNTNNTNNNNNKLSCLIYHKIYNPCQNLNDNTLKAKYPWYFVLKSSLNVDSLKFGEHTTTQTPNG